MGRRICPFELSVPAYTLLVLWLLRRDNMGYAFGNPLAVTIHPQGIASWSDIQSDRGLRERINSSHLYMVVIRPSVTVSISRDRLDIESRNPDDARYSYCVETSLIGFEAFCHGKKVQDVDCGDWRYSHDVAAEVLYQGLGAGCYDVGTYLELLSWDVLYVGMSYGKGYGSLVERLSKHSTILRIMDEHSGLPYDIRIIPMTCTQSAVLGGFVAGRPLPTVGRVQEFVSRDGRLESLDIVAVLENVLISYFKPNYNSTLKDWPVSKYVSAMESVGIDSLLVYLDGSEDTFSVKTDYRDCPERGLALVAEVSGSQRVWNTAYQSALDYDRSIVPDPVDLGSIMCAAVAEFRVSKPRARFYSDALIEKCQDQHLN